MYPNKVHGWHVKVPGGDLHPVYVTVLTGPIVADKALAKVTLGDHTYQHGGYTVPQAIQRLAEKVNNAGVRVWFLAPGETL